jgi:hypothetical protein
LIPGFCRSPVVNHTVGAREREKGVTASSQFTLPVPPLAKRTSPRIVIYMYAFNLTVVCLQISNVIKNKTNKLQNLKKKKKKRK